MHPLLLLLVVIFGSALMLFKKAQAFLANLLGAIGFTTTPNQTGALVLIALLALVWLLKSLLDRHKANRIKQRELAIAAIIRPHLQTLHTRKQRLTYQGDYQEQVTYAWDREKRHFYRNVFALQFPHASLQECSYWIETLLRTNAHAHTPIPHSTRYPDDPIEFERWCAQQLRNQGWHARTTKGSGDQGVDVIATKNGVKLVLQCKLYSSPVGNKAVQEIYAGQCIENAQIAGVVTNAQYTPAAKQAAHQTGVRLLHATDLQNFDHPLTGPWSTAQQNRATTSLHSHSRS